LPDKYPGAAYREIPGPPRGRVFPSVKGKKTGIFQHLSGEGNRINGKRCEKKRFWAVIPPWLIIEAVVILVPVFIFMTIENINRQKKQTTHLLVEKGAALIRSFEAVARREVSGLAGGD